jgi:peptidoglycan/LPS O-acetylase OafA/YrhL
MPAPAAARPGPSAAAALDHQHFRRLDGLRGVAMLMVLAAHCLGVAFDRWELPWQPAGLLLTTRLPGGGRVPPTYLALWPITYGWIAVGIFFVLSGFGIHHAQLRAGGRFKPIKFAGRRFLRVYPPYLLALTASIAFVWVRRGSDHAWLLHQFKYHALLIHNLLPGTFTAINGSMWTLAVECQYYAMYPLLLWARSRSVRWGPIGLAGAVSVATWAALWVRTDWWHVTAVANFTWWNTPAQWVCWAMGMALADRFAAGQRVFGRPVLWGVVLAVATVAAGLFKPTWGLGLTVSAALSVVVIEGSLWSPAKWDWLGNRWLVLMGTISYTFYLWHQPLLEPLAAGLHIDRLRPAVQFCVLMATALVVVGLASWVLHVAVERPSQQASKRFGSRRPRVVAAT